MVAPERPWQRDAARASVVISDQVGEMPVVGPATQNVLQHLRSNSRFLLPPAFYVPSMF